MDHHVKEKDPETMGGVQETVITNPDTHLQALAILAMRIAPPDGENDHSLLGDNTSSHDRANPNPDGEEEAPPPRPPRRRLPDLPPPPPGARKAVVSATQRRKRKLRAMGICIMRRDEPASAGYSSCEECWAELRVRYHPKRYGRATEPDSAAEITNRFRGTCRGGALNAETTAGAARRARRERGGAWYNLRTSRGFPPAGRIAVSDLLNPTPMNYATEATVSNGREVAVVVLY